MSPRDLQRIFSGLGASQGKEDPVEVTRQQFNQLSAEFGSRPGGGMGSGEGQLVRLLYDGINHALIAMS